MDLAISARCPVRRGQDVVWLAMASRLLLAALALSSCGSTVASGAGDGGVLDAAVAADLSVVIDGGGKENLRDVWGSSMDNLYVVGDLGTILRSTDRGKSWKRLNSGTNEDLTAVWGTSPTRIFAVGKQGNILRSVDGGATWTSRPSGNCCLIDVWGVDDLVLAGNKAVIFRSADGGNTWMDVQQAHWVIWGRSAKEIYAPWGALEGWGEIYRSVDAGLTWTKVADESRPNNSIPRVPTAAGGSPLGADVLVAGRVGLFLSSSPDRGNTWVPEMFPNTQQLFSAISVTQDSAFIVGGDGLLMTRPPKGAWTLKPSGTALDLHGVWAAGKSAVAVGDEGTILLL